MPLLRGLRMKLRESSNPSGDRHDREREDSTPQAVAASLLQLAQDLANVSRAYKLMGYSRQQRREGSLQVTRESPALAIGRKRESQKPGGSLTVSQKRG